MKINEIMLSKDEFIEFSSKSKDKDKLCTDFAIALGGIDKNDPIFFVAGENFFDKKSKLTDIKLFEFMNRIALCPSLPTYCFSDKVEFNEADIHKISLGEFPQDRYPFVESCEFRYKHGEFKRTGRMFTIDCYNYANKNNKEFFLQHLEELDMNGLHLVRLKLPYDTIFNDGTKYKRGEVAWFVVKPIIWIVNKNSKFAISEKAIFSGVRAFDSYFHSYFHECGDDFVDTRLRWFLEYYFYKDIFQEGKNRLTL